MSNSLTKLNQRLSFWLAILIVISLIVLFHFLNNSNQKKDRKEAQPVLVSESYVGNMPIYIPALGTVTPTYSVTIRPQVSGMLKALYFHEGDTVKAGQLIAEIDAKPYEAQLLQYQGQYARDLALLNNAKKDLVRYQKLFRLDSVSEQTLATQIALVKQYEGTLKIDLGQIENAKANLAYTKITAPISGRIGLRQVDAGNFVQPSDQNGLVIINTLQPITVLFSIPEDQINSVMTPFNAHQILAAYAYNRDQNSLLAKGQLLTIDNQIDPTTGTIKLKAQFQNQNNQLFPNQFVNIQLLVKTLQNVILIPSAAIQRGIQGTFVYVVNDNTVQIKKITVGNSLNNISTIDGLSAGQTVVVQGADKLTEGASVRIIKR